MQTVNTLKQTTFVVSDKLVQQAKHIARWASDWWYAREREREQKRHARRQLRKALKQRGHQVNQATYDDDDDEDVISDEEEELEEPSTPLPSKGDLAVQLMRDVMEGKSATMASSDSVSPEPTSSSTSTSTSATDPSELQSVSWGERIFLISDHFGTMSHEEKEIMSHLMDDEQIKHQLQQQIKAQDQRDQTLRRQLMAELTQRTRRKSGNEHDTPTKEPNENGTPITSSSSSSSSPQSSGRPLPCAAPVYDTSYFAAAPDPDPSPSPVIDDISASCSSFSSVSPSPSLEDEYDLLSSPNKSPLGTPSAANTGTGTATAPLSPATGLITSTTSTSTSTSTAPMSPVSSIRRVSTTGSAPPAAPVILYSPQPTTASTAVNYDPFSLFGRSAASPSASTSPSTAAAAAPVSSPSTSTSTCASTVSSDTPITTDTASKYSFSFPSFVTAQQYFTALTAAAGAGAGATTTTNTTNTSTSTSQATSSPAPAQATSSSFFGLFSRTSPRADTATTTSTSTSPSSSETVPASTSTSTSEATSTSSASPTSDPAIPSAPVSDPASAPVSAPVISSSPDVPIAPALDDSIPVAPIMSSDPSIPPPPALDGVPCAPGLGPSSSSSTSTASGRTELERERRKKLHWDKLTRDRIEGSIWDGLGTGPPKISLEKTSLTTMFVVRPPVVPVVTSDVASAMSASARAKLRGKGRRRRKQDDSGEDPMDGSDVSSDDDTTVEGNARSRQKKAVKPKTQLLPPLRVYNVEIAFNQLKMTPEAIRDYCLFRLECQTRAIERARSASLPTSPRADEKKAETTPDLAQATDIETVDADPDPLSRDKLEILVKIAPTDEEVSLMRRYKGDAEQLGNVEKFFKILSVIPRVKRRVELLLFRRESDEIIRDVSASLTLVESAYHQLKTSSHLKDVLRLVLDVGNWLNAGTAQGQAHGFRLALLPQLTSTKATPREPGAANTSPLTLMHYIVEQVDRESGAFVTDLSDVSRAASIEMNQLASELASLQLKITQVNDELKHTDPEDPFSWLMSTFVTQLESDYRSLHSRFTTCLANTDDLVRYFAEKEMQWQQLYSIFRDFIAAYTSAKADLERIAQQTREAEARKAKTEKIKAGSGSPRRTHEHDTITTHSQSPTPSASASASASGPVSSPAPASTSTSTSTSSEAFLTSSTDAAPPSSPSPSPSADATPSISFSTATPLVQLYESTPVAVPTTQDESHLINTLANRRVQLQDDE